MDSVKLSKYFTSKEVYCPCGNCKPIMARGDILYLLDSARESLGKPIVIASWQRCRQHNFDEGGAEDSRHVYGDGLDISIPDATYLRDLLKVLFKLSIPPVGLGLYRDMKHIHVDWRPGVPVVWIK